MATTLTTVQSVNSNPNFRKTQAGKSLGKMLFDPKANANISPALIVSLMQNAGLKVPNNVAITADVAQIIMAGGAVSTLASQGASINAYCTPTALAVKSTADILTRTGVITKNSPAAQFMNFGADLALVVSSGGLNVLADLNLVFDIIHSVFSGLPDLTGALTRYAQQGAKNYAYSVYSNLVKGEAPAAAKNFVDFQNKKISIFEFMGYVATESPDIFYNYFPQMKLFMPPAYTSITTTFNVNYTQTGGFFGTQSKNYNISSNFTLTELSTRSLPEDVIIMGMLDSFLKNQSQVYSFLVNNPNLDRVRAINYEDIAVLGLFPPYFDVIPQNFDINPYFRSLMITPRDLDYQVIDEYLINNNSANTMKLQQRDAAISVNGVDTYTKQDALDNAAYAANDKTITQLDTWDRAGNIEALSASQLGNKILKAWAQVTDPPASFSSFAPAYRNVKNYFSLVQLAEYISSDTFIKRYTGDPKNISQYVEKMSGASTSLEDRYRQIQFLSTCRKMNKLAHINIASFFNIDPTKLKLSDPIAGQLTSVIN